MANDSSILAWRIPMDRGAWQATIHEVIKSDMTEQLSTAQTGETTRPFRYDLVTSLVIIQ